LPIYPPPAGEDAFVDCVDVAEELDALRFQLSLCRLDVVDEERNVRRPDVVRQEGLRRLARWALVLQELERRVAEEQADLAQSSAGDADRRAELRPVEPRARLVR